MLETTFMKRTILIIFIFIGSGILYWKTTTSFVPPPKTLSVFDSTTTKAQILDRYSTPLTITYQNHWNIHDYVPLHEIPELLQQIFILAEDKRFFEHNGPDWSARWHAIWQNLKSLELVRGASTITEQTVRIIYPRPRTFWSRWLEGFEATELERHFSKTDILEFYLNQVPYVGQRRGVAQAARHYFDRDLDTLNIKEMMALAVLIRAPSRLDLRRGITEIEVPINYLAIRLIAEGLISVADWKTIATNPLNLKAPDLPVKASHFVNYIYNSAYDENYLSNKGRLHTTLDSHFQQKVQQILSKHIQDLKAKQVNNGAILVVNHETSEVLAWVNAGQSEAKVASKIDAITTPRQPGSTLKPFLYALALEQGWTAATVINDTPLTAFIGTGMHNYRNYSRYYYGSLRMRDTLGNSLNIPAIRTIQFVGKHNFLNRLHQLGMRNLTSSSEYYGDGLALGNGEITLLELVQAYTVLANRGLYRPLKFLRETSLPTAKRIFTPEITSIIANILSDSDARRLEFGRSSVLRFPVQTAIKTGTSTDYRDAWVIGFNHRYTVGIWLGNLNQKPMLNVSGASGTALILRSVFAELNRYTETKPLYLSPKLVKKKICRDSGQTATINNCPSRIEWFIAGTEPQSNMANYEPKHQNFTIIPRFKQPMPNLQLAMDPRIPDEYEAYALILENTLEANSLIEWFINDIRIGSGYDNQFLWSLKRGTHIAHAIIWSADEGISTAKVKFHVK